MIDILNQIITPNISNNIFKFLIHPTAEIIKLFFVKHVIEENLNVVDVIDLHVLVAKCVEVLVNRCIVRNVLIIIKIYYSNNKI